MREWGVPRSAFAPLVSLGYLGMMIGGALAGIAGDRFGRRTALLASMAMFGVMTLAAATARGPAPLGWLRLLAGIGLGGAMPNAAALVGGVRSAASTADCGDAHDCLCPAWRDDRRPPRDPGAACARLAHAVCGRRRHSARRRGGAASVCCPSRRAFSRDIPMRWQELVRLLARIGHPVECRGDVSSIRPSASSSARPIRALFSREYRATRLRSGPLSSDACSRCTPASAG